MSNTKNVILSVSEESPRRVSAVIALLLFVGVGLVIRSYSKGATSKK